MSYRVLFDVTRMVRRTLREAPTGIDRVEQAYAARFLRLEDGRSQFIARTLAGWREVPRREVEAMLALWDVRLDDADLLPTGPAPKLPGRGRRLAGQLRIRGPRRRRDGGPLIYVNVGHTHLDTPATLERLLARHDARFVTMVHDIIPLTHPEYARPPIVARHRLRMSTVSRLADRVIVNSAATGQELAAHYARTGERCPPMTVALLGMSLDQSRDPAPPPPEGAPVFVTLGTIEGRKNHILLLHVWRRMAELGVEPMPKLLVLGKRGWENEQVLDLLDRCEAIRPYVLELPRLSDADLRATMRSARALLFPSFAEGFGLPLPEALAFGLPVIASDLPAFREIGGLVPDYLDPLDGPGWMAAIVDYAAPQSERRAAQLARLTGWSPPRWADHFARVDQELEAVAAGERQRT